MKAIILTQTGGIENFEIQEIPKPSIGDNEVLIQTKAIGINPVDYKVRANEDVLSVIYGPQRPAILGWDISGLVVEKGSAVSTFEIGDAVFGMVNFLGAGKTYAEYVAAPEDHLTKIPANITFEEAAASTLAALTALQVLQGKIAKENKVLIHAGSGGVGHFAIQIAKSLGAYVTSTSSAANREFIISLGADQHIDYRQEAFQEVLSEIDFVFDMLDGEVLYNSIKVVKAGGTVVSITTREFSAESRELAAQKGVNLAIHMVQSSGKDMATIAQMLKTGTIKPYLSQVFKFDEMGKAHQQLESGRTVGKLVVTL